MRHQVFFQSNITQKRFLSKELNTDYQHGTAIASLLVANSPQMSGITPSTPLYSASIFSLHPKFGIVATSENLIKALDWLVSENVKIINISISGPANDAVKQAIKKLTQKGIIIVAAVGNEGPLSAPRFPAAYDGVIAVTAIDNRGRAYKRAGRGSHVDYAAPGVNLSAASISNKSSYTQVTGTSYAAALATGLMLYYLNLSDDPSSVVSLLDNDVVDLGAPGADPVYGKGLLGKSLLTDKALH